MTTKPWILVPAVLAAVAFAVLVPKSGTATEIAPFTRRVTVSGRDYIELRLPDGTRTVTLSSNPLVTVTFSKDKIVHEMGDPKLLAQLKSDLNSFPE